MHGWKRLVLFVLILAAIGLGLYQFVFKTLYYSPPERSRSGITNSWFQTGFSVAIVWPVHSDLSLVEGVTLALEEVNAGGGPLAPVQRDDVGRIDCPGRRSISRRGGRHRPRTVDGEHPRVGDVRTTRHPVSCAQVHGCPPDLA
jgi:hypothetical protein